MKFVDSKIVALDNQVDNSFSLIPRPNFSLNIVAQKGAGKTSLLLNMLLNPHILNKVFNAITIVSPTYKLDDKWKILEKERITSPNKPLMKLLEQTKRHLFYDVNYKTNPTHENNIEYFDEPNLEILNDIIKEQNYVINKFGKQFCDKVLIILDDCIAFKQFINSVGFRRFIFNSRHYNCSVILTSQTYFDIPKPVRLNASGLILFYNGNEEDMKLIYKENSSRLTFKEFWKMYQEVCSVAYNFLYVNYQNKMADRFIRNFEEVLGI
ncbi:hypothetical protein HDV06_001356 [Boothiomyces sp. JEL0866]|nr:hypothetical protein HDV06_001356 [Boothiomyces sp. JEL0866]